MWWTQALEILTEKREQTGKYRMTATSDEDGGGPYGNVKCFHDTKALAEQCDDCNEYVSRITGFPSRKEKMRQAESRDQAEYERLKAKYEDKK